MSKIEEKELGELIKAALKERGLNQSAIAKKMNVSKQVINQIDRRKNFDLEFLERLREVTGLDFTSHYKHRQINSLRLNEDQGPYGVKHNVVEMSLAIRIKGTSDEILQLGELVSHFKAEAVRRGFSIA